MSEVFVFSSSGELDSNQRPLAPHTSALPGCATTRTGVSLLVNHQRRAANVGEMFQFKHVSNRNSNFFYPKPDRLS